MFNNRGCNPIPLLPPLQPVVLFDLVYSHRCPSSVCDESYNNNRLETSCLVALSPLKLVISVEKVLLCRRRGRIKIMSQAFSSVLLRTDRVLRARGQIKNAFLSN